MSLPKVNVNVGEETVVTANSQIPFIPAVLLKTKSGPIGTVETIQNETQFKAIFGESDYTTPSAYAIQTYLRSYSFMYVTRLANDSEANYGTGKMTFTKSESPIELISAKTDYKTDLFNGKEIKLIYNGVNHKLWLDVSSITGKSTISIKEDFTADTADATTLSAALDKLITSINSANLGFKLTNLYTNKISSDDAPQLADYNAGFNMFITEGNSGNSTNLDTADVKAMIDLYDIPDRNIDIMVVPEYTNYEIVNYAVDLAKKNNFVVLTSPNATTVDTLKQAILNYSTDNQGSLAIYYPDVYYNNFYDNIGNLQAIPASVAVLHAYAKTDNLTKWGAPAGVTRGTLSLVNSLTVKLSESMLSELYDNTIPVNCINTISGKGFIVWGNKTTNASSEFFDRVNVSRLIKYVTKQIALISWDYLFEPITIDVFTNWTARVNNLLENIKSGFGLEAYDVTMDSSVNTPETIAANQLNGIVKIKPQEVAEFINIDFLITDTVSVSVEE